MMHSLPLSEFHLFPLLPAELRLKIWSHILSLPRIVHVKVNKGITLHSQPRRFAKSFTSPSPPPAALHICRESRAEGLLRYKPLFQTSASDIYTYACFDQDTISMSDSDLAYLGAEELQGIQRMTVDVSDCVYFGHFNIGTLEKMGSLKELEIVTQEENVAGGIRTWHPQVLMWDFEDERKSDPGWVCPRVRIVGRSTGKLIGLVEGGAIVPGWNVGDPFPFLADE